MSRQPCDKLDAFSLDLFGSDSFTHEQYDDFSSLVQHEHIKSKTFSDDQHNLYACYYKDTLVCYYDRSCYTDEDDNDDDSYADFDFYWVSLDDCKTIMALISSYFLPSRQLISTAKEWWTE